MYAGIVVETRNFFAVTVKLKGENILSVHDNSIPLQTETCPVWVFLEESKFHIYIFL